METCSPTIKLEHADSRGEIYSIELPDGQELMLLHSVAGAFRGGHSHDVSEIVVLLSGKMRYHKKVVSIIDGSVRDYVSCLAGGDTSFNRAGQVHMGEFLEHSWLIEYKLDTKKGRWTQTDYEPYRERVRASQG